MICRAAWIRPFWFVASATCLILATNLTSIAKAQGPEDSAEKIERLIGELKQGAGGANDAAEELRRIDKSAVPALIQALKHADIEIRIRAVALLSMIDPNNPQIISALIQALDRVPLRRFWVGMLAELPEQIEPDMLAVALSELGPSAEKPLIESLAHKRPGARAVAAMSLALLAGAPGTLDPRPRPPGQQPSVLPAGAVSGLLKLLGDANATVRSGAARALGKLDLKSDRVDEVTAALIGRLKDPQSQVRCFAVEAIDHFGPRAKGAVTTLSVMFDAEESADPKTVLLGRSAIGFLLKVSSWFGPDAQSALQRFVLLNLFEFQFKPPIYLIARTIGSMGMDAAPAVPMLIRRSRDKRAEYRECAILALGRIGPHVEGVLPALRAALEDPEESVRQRASEALSALGKAVPLKSTE